VTKSKFGPSQETRAATPPGALLFQDDSTFAEIPRLVRNLGRVVILDDVAGRPGPNPAAQKNLTF
jgi:hypothetical protein